MELRTRVGGLSSPQARLHLGPATDWKVGSHAGAHDPQSDQADLYVGFLLVRVRAAHNTATKASGMATAHLGTLLRRSLGRGEPTPDTSTRALPEAPLE